MSLKKIFIVLGMHRSGTSAVARSLQVMDIHLGDHLMPPNPLENAKGFWEDMDIYELNTALLKYLGMDWDSPWELTEEEFQELMSGTFMEGAIDLIKSKIAPHDLFGVKDPRFSVLLPFWDKVFASCDLEPQYILALRNPANVAMSLKKRNQLKEEEGYILWLRYNLLALKHFDSKKNNIHVIQYESLLKSPRECIAKLSLDLNLKINTQKLDEYISSFIDLSLEHHHLSIEELKNTKRAPQFLKTLYGELVQLSNQNQDAYERFFNDNRMQWNKELENLSPFFKALKNIHSKANVESKKYLEKINKLDDEILAKNSEIALLDKEISSRDKWTLNLDKEIIKLNDEVFKRGEWGLRLDKEIDELKKIILERDGKITNLNEAIKKQESEVNQLNKVILERDGKITNLNHEISSRDKWSLNLDKEIIRLNDEVFNRGEWGLRLNKEIDELKGEIFRRGEWGLRLNKEIETQQIRLDSMVNSYSWKMTAPLRAIFRVISSPSFYFKKIIPRLFYLAAYIFNRLPINLKTKLLVKNFLLTRFAWLKNIQNNQHQIFKGDTQETTPVEKSSAKTSSNESLKIKIDEIEIPSFSEPVVSIIIPIYGKVEFTVNCLLSISQHLPKNSFEIIVVNDLSPDNSLELLNGIKNIKIIKNKMNRGFIYSCNLGAKRAKGKYLYFLNNDTEVTEGWLDSLIDTFNLYPKVGLVGSKLIYPDSSLQEAGGILWQDGSAWNYGRGQDPNLPHFNYVREVDYCSGASIVIPKKIFFDLGGFDKDFMPAYCEDSDLALKVRQKGYKVLYQPFSKIIHHEGITSGTDLSAGAKSYQVENSKKLFIRWKEFIKNYGANGENVDRIKDRQSKYKVLVLDKCTPTPDQDAGSISIFNIMLILREMGFQITFIPEDNFLYIPEYTTLLQKNGIEVLYGPFNNSVEDHLKSLGQRYDLVLLSRPEVVMKHIQSIKEYCLKAKTLFYTHDLHFLRMNREADLLKDKRKKTEANEMKKIELNAVKEVDLSIAVSESERDILKSNLPKANIHSLPLILNIPGTEYTYKSRKDILFVGGFQHHPNVDAMVYFVKEIMPMIRLKLPGVKLNIVGSKPPKEIESLASRDVIILGFVKDLRPILDKSRLLIAPLRYGAGVKGKVGTAMAHGLPAVGTEIAAEGMALKHKNDMLIAKDPKRFAASVVELYKDPILWSKLSQNGILFAQENFSANATGKLIGTMLNQLSLKPKTKINHLKLYSS